MSDLTIMVIGIGIIAYWNLFWGWIKEFEIPDWLDAVHMVLTLLLLIGAFGLLALFLSCHLHLSVK